MVMEDENGQQTQDTNDQPRPDAPPIANVSRNDTPTDAPVTDDIRDTKTPDAQPTPSIRSVAHTMTHLRSFKKRGFRALSAPYKDIAKQGTLTLF